MRKLIALVATVLLGGLVYGFFLPRQWHVEQSIVIAAPIERVSALVQSLRAWPSWAMPPDLKLDPEFFGDDGQAGQRMRWAGGAEIAIKTLEIGRGVTYEQRYGPDQTRPIHGALALTQTGDGVRVTWTDHGDMGSNPLARYFLGRVEHDVSSDMKQGLDRLKQRAEEKK